MAGHGNDAPKGEEATVVAFLDSGGLGQPATRIDTHAARIFLAGDRAFKMKRPVRFSFLDFTTLAAREGALRHELYLNRRTAPDLYLRVVPVTREPDGALALDGAGDAVEWLLEMLRFDQAGLLSQMAETAPLAVARIDDLAAMIARFHAAAPVIDGTGDGGIAAVVEGDESDLGRSAGTVLAGEAVEALITATRTALVAALPRLRARAASGFVRHCHGDLHLANIVLRDGQPVLFDCIEFNDAFARIDTLYDLAFLVMDLVERGQGPSAQRLLSSYLDRCGDDAGTAALPLFISLRAAIRAKVTAFAGERETAQRYLELARNALEPAPPRLLAIGGRSGTGKTTLAMALAPDLGAMPGAVVLRSDVIRKGLFGRDPLERLPPEAYTEAVSSQVFETIAARATTLLLAGRTVIADAVYGRDSQRSAIEAVAQDAGVPFSGLWLVAADATLVERVAARAGDASDADVAVVRAQRSIMDAPAWTRIETTRGLPAVVAAARAALVHDER